MRNLVFEIREKHLEKLFNKFGDIDHVNVPMNMKVTANNRGFGFVEFKTKEVAQKAVAEMNGTTFKGRSITCEMSLPKSSYETKVQHVVENTKMNRADVIKPKSVKQQEKNQPKEEAAPEKPPAGKKEPKIREQDSDQN